MPAKALPLEESDEFVVLASDGLFDVFDNEQVVRIVRAADDPQVSETRPKRRGTDLASAGLPP